MVSKSEVIIAVKSNETHFDEWLLLASNAVDELASAEVADLAPRRGVRFLREPTVPQKPTTAYAKIKQKW